MNNKTSFLLPIGISDFQKIRTNDYYYIDKTLFIRDIIRSHGEVLLIPRPRRFGKTLNMTMLRYFFEKTKESRNHLFDGLMIEKEAVFSEYQGRYPVIWISFKDVKHQTWEDCLQNLQGLISDEFARHRYLFEGDTLFPDEKMYVESILKRKAARTDYENALKYLSRFLRRYINERVVILLDEYDTPIHSAYNCGYYGEVIAFMRNLLSGGLKDNEHLYRGVITGILRVAKESIFSGLNNLNVYSILDEDFSTYFGFTESETAVMLRDYDMADRHEEVSLWYNGYLFGDHIIYNPWSVLNYVAKKGKPHPYWKNTAGTELMDQLATRGGKELREELGQLFEAQTIVKPIYDSIVMKDLDIQDNLLWSFLLFSGYLKPLKQTGEESFELATPNQEVRSIYRDLIRRWFDEKVESNCLEEMLKALETGDIILFERLLQKIVLQVMSFHDLSGQPEKVYHALVIGMLVWMSDRYDIRSNRESGYGRYDIMLKPKEQARNGIIIEFKMIEKDESPEKTLENALEQIKKRKYETELEAAGVQDVLKIAVAFQGKELWVKSA